MGLDGITSCLAYCLVIMMVVEWVVGHWCEYVHTHSRKGARVTWVSLLILSLYALTSTFCSLSLLVACNWLKDQSEVLTNNTITRWFLCVALCVLSLWCLFCSHAGAFVATTTVVSVNWWSVFFFFLSTCISSISSGM